MKRSQPTKIKKPANTAGEVGPDARSVAQQFEEIIENDEMLSEPTLDDVLVDRQKHMSCTDWKKAQDAYPAIKHMRELIKEFGHGASNKRQLKSAMAELKSLCDHWNLLEIVHCVVTCRDRGFDR